MMYFSLNGDIPVCEAADYGSEDHNVITELGDTAPFIKCAL